jgi:methyltransferase (TIGR00027 family)
MRADQPSATAELIARALLVCAADPARSLLVPTADIPCLRKILAPLGRRRWLDVVLRHGERFVLPGIFLHYLARKRWLERAVVRHLCAGATHVTVLGAGCDLLAWRLHRAWPQVEFCEVDHPATQRLKRAALAPASNLSFRPADLSRDLSSLRAAAPGASPCFVAEGLLMYLPAERVAEVFRTLAQPGATLAFTFMEPDASGRAAFRAGHPGIARWLRAVGEPFAWSVARADLAAWVGDVGWNLEVTAGPAELRREILAPAGLGHAALAEGECLAVASARP